jgi:5-(carboxyamino)imidazole ribonucleotide mutase
VTGPALVAVIMGSKSDWATMKHAADTLDQLEVPNETRVLSAHRTPDQLFEYVAGASGRGVEVIIAGAGGAAHLPGVIAAKSLLPVLGVPMESQALKGLDSLLSIVQMPGGVPVGTLGIGKAGAVNAALLAARILAGKHTEVATALESYVKQQAEAVLANPDPSAS